MSNEQREFANSILPDFQKSSGRKVSVLLLALTLLYSAVAVANVCGVVVDAVSIFVAFESLNNSVNFKQKCERFELNLINIISVERRLFWGPIGKTVNYANEADFSFHPDAGRMAAGQTQWGSVSVVFGHQTKYEKKITGS